MPAFVSLVALVSFVPSVPPAATLAEPARFAPFEIVLLLACAVLSAALFLRRLLPILNIIRRSKPDPDLTFHPLGPRIWAFFSEVLCQSKVIRQRPIPGLLHAFVFWGFLAFALVTLNHLAVAFGLGFLAPDRPIGGFYFLFAGLWALLVAVSITGLFLRRFVLRPLWLGKKLSYESGFIALLILLLMLTYLGAFLIPASSPALKALWWTHTLTLLVFLPLIPHTKHLHLVLSPITIFFKRDGFSKIPPLVGDDDLGLVAGKDLTQLISLQTYSCVECGRCTEHCPAANTGKLLNPKEIILGARTYLNDHGPLSDLPLLSDVPRSSPDNPPAAYLSMEAAFQCTTCGACEYQCPVGIQHLPILIGLRRGATNTGAWEDPYGTKLFLALEKTGNALGLSSTERDKFIAKQAFPIFDGTQEYCLWLGCMGSYDPKGREIVADFARIMTHLGTTFGVLKKEKCTGDPARRLGNDLVFQNLAEAGLKAFETARVQKIVSICPHCIRTIATDWREFGVAPEIEHHSEFLARHQSLLPNLNDSAATAPPLAEPQDIVFHDPCYLGRYQGCYEPPRAVVALSGQPLEAAHHHERSLCCGAGGGLAFLGEEAGAHPHKDPAHTNPESAPVNGVPHTFGEPARMSHVRARELTATGAQIIGTACPFCNTMFRDALVAITPAGQTPPSSSTSPSSPPATCHPKPACSPPNRPCIVKVNVSQHSTQRRALPLMSFLRKSLFLLPFLAVALSLPAQSPQSAQALPPPSSTTHSAADLTQLEARLKAQAEKAPNGDATQTIEDQGTNWIVLVYRAHTGEAELHKDWSDEILVRSGTMTVVYGGTMSPQHPFGSRLGEFHSESITGGTTQVLHTGDLLHIPADVPHWVKIAPGESASYLVFKEM